MKITNLNTNTAIPLNNLNNTSKKIIKTTSDNLFNFTKPVKPELLEYTGITIALIWIALVIWVKQIGKKKNLKEN